MLNFRKLNWTKVHYKMGREINFDFNPQTAGGIILKNHDNDKMICLFVKNAVDHGWNHNSRPSGSTEKKDDMMRARG